MKKILFLMLMFMGLLSSLYALDTSQVGCGIESKSQMNATGDFNTAEVSDTATIIISHKDTLMYSWGEGVDNKIMRLSSLATDKPSVPKIGGGYSSNIGEGGV